MKPTLLCKSLLLASLIAGVPHSLSQGTAFTYQGRLNDGANPAHGSFDLRFALYDAAGAGTQQGNALTNLATAVGNGLFTVTLDFGTQFPGPDRWLEIAVRTNGAASFFTLSPRQALTPTPYSIHSTTSATAASADSVAAGNITGTLPLAKLPPGLVTNGATGVDFTGSFTGNGSGLTSLSAGNVTGGTLSDARLSSNIALRSGGNTLSGTQTISGNVGINTNNPNGAALAVNGKLTTTGDIESPMWSATAVTNAVSGPSANIKGGYSGNIISNGVAGGSIGGGGSALYPNRVGTNFATVVGGANNSAYGFASTAMGDSTTASGNGSTAMGAATRASGLRSTAMGAFTTASGDYSTAMGDGTTASGDYSMAMGAGTFAGGLYSMALGYQSEARGIASVSMGVNAAAMHNNCFVWSDGSSASSLISTAPSQFLIRAAGGVGIGSSAPKGMLEIQGGAGSSGNLDGRSIALAYFGGGFRHWIRSRHNAGPGAGNSIDFYVNTGSTAEASTGPGTNSVLGLTIDAANGGSVGIGTANPERLLQLGDVNVPNSQGMMRFSSRSGAGGARRSWDVGVPETDEVTQTGAGYSFVIDDTAAGNGAPEMIIKFDTGNVGIGITEPSSKLHVNGTVTATAFNPPSDRNLKENFAPVSPQEVLEKVAGLAISRWNFIGDQATPHVGPMAQDFHAAFGLGTDDKHIATVDADGVALAAIQGLNQKLEQTRAENAELKRELAQIKEMLTKLSEPKP